MITLIIWNTTSLHYFTFSEIRNNSFGQPLLRQSFGDLMHEVLLEHVDGDWSGPGPGVDTQECLLPASVSQNCLLASVLQILIDSTHAFLGWASFLQCLVDQIDDGTGNDATNSYKTPST